jgi:hypothetical protein
LNLQAHNFTEWFEGGGHREVPFECKFRAA